MEAGMPDDEQKNGNGGNTFGLPYIVMELRKDVTALQATTVPRTESELRWKNNESRASDLKSSIDEVSKKVDTLVEGDIPRRLDKVENILAELPGKILKNTSIVVSLISAFVAAVVWLVAHANVHP
jgi:hypothetical protein